MKKLKYVTLFTDGTWGIVYTYNTNKFGLLPEESRVSRSHNSTRAIKSRVSTYLLGNASKISAVWIKGTDWTRERLADCLENPSKYKRKSIKKGRD